MLRKFLTHPAVIPFILVLQLIPLLVFPAQSYSPASQEWWLPVLLGFLAFISTLQLLIRRSHATWPWYLISFAQGFNIISRLMMLMPHAMVVVDGVDRFNTPYVLLSLLAMVWSGLMLWYGEQPEVRRSVFRTREATRAG